MKVRQIPATDALVEPKRRCVVPIHRPYELLGPATHRYRARLSHQCCTGPMPPSHLRNEEIHYHKHAAGRICVIAIVIEQVSDDCSRHFGHEPCECWLWPKSVAFECVRVESKFGGLAESAQVMCELSCETRYRRHVSEPRFSDHILVRSAHKRAPSTLSRRTSELTGRGDYIQSSPHQSSYKTRSSAPVPICSPSSLAVRSPADRIVVNDFAATLDKRFKIRLIQFRAERVFLRHVIRSNFNLHGNMSKIVRSQCDAEFRFQRNEAG